MATFGLIATIVAGIVIIVAAGMVLNVIMKIRSAIAPIATLANNMDAQELEMELTPKSVSSMTSVYLPRIQRDFPEFSYNEFKAKAENMMKSAFNAITTEDISKLVNASSDLTSQINNIITSNKANRFKESFSNIEIHRTEIKNYVKNAGNCVITLQSSVGYVHYVEASNGEIVRGTKDHKFQTRYDIDLMYVQDATKVAEEGNFTANNCPNCGAPIKGLGYKSCPYCGSGVEEINIRTWAIKRLAEC